LARTQVTMRWAQTLVYSTVQTLWSDNLRNGLITAIIRLVKLASLKCFPGLYKGVIRAILVCFFIWPFCGYKRNFVQFCQQCRPAVTSCWRVSSALFSHAISNSTVISSLANVKKISEAQYLCNWSSVGKQYFSNKTANINVQNISLFSSTLTHSQCDAGNITFCDFCCF